MEIRAYSEDYLAGAQRILGDAVDFAVMTLGIEPDRFGNVFAVSDTSRQFASGNPKYVAGMNGCELARKVLKETQVSFLDQEDIMYVDKGPEYWAGWALAFYQWNSCYSFMEILSVVPLSKIISMHYIFHEMDVAQFADRMRSYMKASRTQTRLRVWRENSGLSQAKLADASKVSLRQIQLFEQRQRDINKSSAETILKLSKALNCRMEDLLER